MSDRPNGNSTPPAVARPGVLSINIREKAALYAAYMPYLAEQFRYGEESQSWFLLRRHPQAAAAPDRVPFDEPVAVIRALSSPAPP